MAAEREMGLHSVLSTSAEAMNQAEFQHFKVALEREQEKKVLSTSTKHKLLNNKLFQSIHFLMETGEINSLLEGYYWGRVGGAIRAVDREKIEGVGGEKQSRKREAEEKSQED